MKKITQLALAATLAAGSLCAQAGGHYVAGVEGIQAASVPPPGMYYLAYLVDYNIDQFKIPGTSNNLPGHNTGTVTAMANRFVWISPYKVLGADFGMEAIVPLLNKSLTINAAGISESKNGVGDVYLGPLVLGWHGANWDAVAAAGFWLDNADSDTPASVGNGYRSTMLTGGATYYFDAAKTITASALMRFENNSKMSNGFKPGNQISLEWGIAKNLGTVQVGVVGYDQMQTSQDSGTGASANKSSRHAIGAEVALPIMSAGVFLKAAVYKEYSAEAGSGPEPKGNLFRFTFVKAF